MKRKKLHTLSVLAQILVLACIAGCMGSSATLVDLEAEDDAVFIPSLRATLDLLKDHESETEDAPGVFSKSTLAADLEFDFASAKGSQSLSSGEMVVLDKVSFPGPDRVDVDFDLYQLRANIRGGFRPYKSLTLEGTIGLSFENLDIKVESGTMRETDEIFTFGPIIGARITYQPLHWLKVYGRASQSYALIDSNDVETSILEAGFELTTESHLSLILGWREWGYEADRSGGRSDLDLEITGPVVALQFTF